MIKHGESPGQNFRTLSDTKTVELMTRSTTDNEIQVTFHHTIRGSQLTKNVEYCCLMGGGLRAHAVKVDPANLFCRSSTKKKLPNIQQFLACKSTKDIMDLKATMSPTKEYVNYYSTLTPVMLNEIIVEDDYSTQHTLLKLIKK